LGKPADEADAVRMLRGAVSTHQVHNDHVSGYARRPCAVRPGDADVPMRDYGEDEIAALLQRVRPAKPAPTPFSMTFISGSDADAL
jgi:hypothetical protein